MISQGTIQKPYVMLTKFKCFWNWMCSFV